MDKLEKNTDSNDFRGLRKEVSKQIGVDYENYSKRHLRRRFHARMRVTGEFTFSGYLSHLRKDGEEIENLKKLLTVNVTKFKRDIEVWDLIEREVIPKLIDHKKDEVLKKLKIWSAGCATGEEPYSLAISYLKNNPPDEISCQITATDLADQALEFAENGEYPKKSLKNLSKKEMRRYILEIDQDGGGQVREKLKELVKFERNDIFKSSFKRKFDLILCRNLMIYFNNDAKSELMYKLVESLNKGGFLIIGMAENLRSPAKEELDNYNLRKRIFRKN